MIRKLVIFLVRKKLGLKLYEDFKFENQKSNTEYYFTKKKIVKVIMTPGEMREEPSSVSLNFLLSDECKIVKL